MFNFQKTFAILISILILLCATTLSAVPASANEIPNAILTFTVNSTEDLPDFATNSVCSAGKPTDGPCTLRAAISEASGNIDYTPVMVLIPPGTYVLSLPPTSPDTGNNGDLNIKASTSGHLITIKPTKKGEVVITTSFNDRILEIGNGTNVQIENVTFSGANYVMTEAHFDGGGAIHNMGNLRLHGTTFHNNSVSCAQGQDCGSKLIGGAILNHGVLEIRDATFSQNSADRGFAIFNAGGNPYCNISSSLFTENSGSLAGTIMNFAYLTIVNSTLSNNSSNLGNYAGISNSGTNGYLTVQSSTFNNRGNYGSIDNSATAYISDSIFMSDAGKTGFSSTGSWTSGGYNIFNDSSFPGTLATGDLVNTDPLLGNLANYGGPTRTHSLLPGSPAINHRPGRCQIVMLFIEKDQRHQPRADGRCDTGAYELGSFYLPMIIK